MVGELLMQSNLLAGEQGRRSQAPARAAEEVGWSGQGGRRGNPQSLAWREDFPKIVLTARNGYMKPVERN